MRKETMDTFWSESWKMVDPQRIAEYTKTIDMTPDEIISVLNRYQAKTVCDAGCGCGVYCAKLLHNGFAVAGFDVSEAAVQIAKQLAPTVELKAADIRETGYPDDSFDAVVSRDVLDHMTKNDARSALSELRRIVKLGGVVVFTLDFSDDSYEQEPHEKNNDGDLIFTGGKWAGMVFHPYTGEEIAQIVPKETVCSIEQRDGQYLVVSRKVC